LKAIALKVIALKVIALLKAIAFFKAIQSNWIALKQIVCCNKL
jgi:hypothetical protein